MNRRGSNQTNRKCSIPSTRATWLGSLGTCGEALPPRAASLGRAAIRWRNWPTRRTGSAPTTCRTRSAKQGQPHQRGLTTVEAAGLAWRLAEARTRASATTMTASRSSRRGASTRCKRCWTCAIPSGVNPTRHSTTPAEMPCRHWTAMHRGRVFTGSNRTTFHWSRSLPNVSARLAGFHVVPSSQNARHAAGVRHPAPSSNQQTAV